jgi:DNA-binding SARP family transcriptional activator
MMRWGFGLQTGELTSCYDNPPHDLGWSPAGSFALPVHWAHGRAHRLLEPASPQWAAAIGTPLEVEGLRLLGRAGDARERYLDVKDRRRSDTCLAAMIFIELALDGGRREDLEAALGHGEERVRTAGAPYYILMCKLLEAKASLLLLNDIDRARAALDHVTESMPARDNMPLLDALDTWTGLADLYEQQDARAARVLSGAVERMHERQRMLFLPFAAAFLSEAQWRIGDEEAADASAALALSASETLGSTYSLMQALTSVPGVASRQISAQQDPDTRWHELGRQLLRGGAHLDTTVVAPGLELRDIGDFELRADGQVIDLRLRKAYELLAVLAAAGDYQLQREQLLDLLFDSRADDSARSYLRQAIALLRGAIPAPGQLNSVNGTLQLTGVLLRVQSELLRARLHQAANSEGDRRIDGVLEMARELNAGEYLPGASTEWAGNRRDELRQEIVDAQIAAAGDAIVHSRFADAQALLDEAVAGDPFREAAWRERMHLASLLGDDDRVLAEYKSCTAALDSVGLVPSAATARALDLLRR